METIVVAIITGGKYIMDHAGQEFRGLWDIQP